MADQLLNNLITAVNNLRDNADGNNTNPSVSQRQQQAATNSETTSQALRRLYPSIDQLNVLPEGTYQTLPSLLHQIQKSPMLLSSMPTESASAKIALVTLRRSSALML